MSKEQIQLLESKTLQIFIILFSVYSLFGLLSIFNFNFCKRITGLITFLMAVIYCNPISTINKNFEKNKYEPQKWKLYIPSLEFILISALGFIMILSSFYYKNDEVDEIKDDEQPKKDKVN